MQLDKKAINLIKMKYILDKYRDLFQALENYDKTRELPLTRKKIYITLSAETIKKLEEIRKKTGKPISRIIESKFR